MPSITVYQKWVNDGTKDERLTLITGWFREGMTKMEIAKKLGISCDTFYKYERDYPDFYEAVKKGRDVITFEIENKFIQRCLGYEYDEITTEMGIETKRVRKHVPPDVGALCFYLKNHMKHLYRQNPVPDDGSINKLDEILKRLDDANV